jgi:hypothetical protein
MDIHKNSFFDFAQNMSIVKFKNFKDLIEVDLEKENLIQFPDTQLKLSIICKALF